MLRVNKKHIAEVSKRLSMLDVGEGYTVFCQDVGAPADDITFIEEEEISAILRSVNKGKYLFVRSPMKIKKEYGSYVIYIEIIKAI